jgi:flagellin
MKIFATGAGNLGGQAKKLQVGANSGQVISFKMATITKTGANATITQGGFETNASSITIDASVYSASSNETYGTAIKKIDDAINIVSKSRSNLGALQNRLEHTIANADNTSENLQAAESRIRDVDMADEMVKYSKSSILQQAGQSMLAQANQSTQGVLSLLR